MNKQYDEILKLVDDFVLQARFRYSSGLHHLNSSVSAELLVASAMFEVSEFVNNRQEVIAAF